MGQLKIIMFCVCLIFSHGSSFKLKDQEKLKASAMEGSCILCPPTELVEPCACFCGSRDNLTLVTLFCNEELQNEKELQLILENGNFLDNYVYKLSVVGTSLQGAIVGGLFDPISFTEIELINNDFKFVDIHAFQTSAETLTHLDLNSNEICFFPWETLKENRKVKTLILDNNKLETIPTESLPESFITSFSASRNRIYYLGSRSFAELPYIENIDLSNNQLTSLSDEALMMHPNRVTSERANINLSFNLISELSSQIFNGMKPANVDLRNNRLEILNEEVFRDIFATLKNLISIYVDGNPLKCDCSFSWILKNESYTQSFDDFYCPIQGKKFSEMHTSDLGQCT